MLNQLKAVAVFSLVFFSWMQCVTSAFALNDEPLAIVAPQWLQRVPTIEEQLQFHEFLKALGRTHDLGHQASFERVRYRQFHTADASSCKANSCDLEAHAKFPGSRLYLLRISVEKHRQHRSVIFTSGSDSWHEAHLFCSRCNSKANSSWIGLAKSFITYIKNANPVAKPVKPAVSVVEIPKSAPKRTQHLVLHKMRRTYSKSMFSGKNLALLMPVRKGMNGPVLGFQSKSKKKEPNKSFSLNLLRFRLAEKKYNQLIWKGIKKQLMFFRMKNRNKVQTGIKAKLRLDIDASGKVIWKKLLAPSRSKDFNRRILDSVNKLDLPPPMDILVGQPPYVVTIVIQP